MSDLFNRDFAMTVGTQKIPVQAATPVDDRIQPMLKVTFSVEKSTNRDPNRANISIYNLSETTRKMIQEGANLIATYQEEKRPYEWPLAIEAGYVGDIQELFTGDIRFVNSHKEKVNWITVLEAEDGGKNYASKRMSQSFGAGTTLTALLSAAAKALGVGFGNSIAKFSSPIRGLVAFKKGVTVVGKVSDILDTYVGTAGYQWSIQEGQLQILAPGETTMETVIVLNAASGLIGSPEMGDDGTVTFRSLMQPSIKPGRRVFLESRTVTGFFKIDHVSYVGDTWGTDWYTVGEGKSTSDE